MSLLEKHIAHIARLRSAKVRILSYQCPKCGETIDTQAAPKGDAWDTLTTCPHCDDLHMKITRHSAVVALRPNCDGQH